MADDLTEKSLEEALIQIAREHPDFYEKYVIKGDPMTADIINTMYGGEYAPMLIEKCIPFKVTYDVEFQTSFHVHEAFQHRAHALLMQLRGSKL